jgi:NAD(P)-dependent dehydrogenase (short-subunit alcohol dehydrogenase family)
MNTSGEERPVAFVSGASRGIGRASAIALAEAGFDVVVTARTLHEGETADGRPLPGSIETTAASVEAKGRRALPLYLDLLDEGSMQNAVETTLDRWGRIDVLLNNAIYIGPANMSPFLEIDLDDARRLLQGNLLAQVALTQKILPHMLRHGRGLIVNMVSNAALNDPPAPAGSGGWGFAYGASKAALLRMAGVLAIEHPGAGVDFVNLEPGFVLTEAMKLNDPDGELSKYAMGAPVEVPGRVIAWLARDDHAAKYNGKIVFAQPLCLELDLHPDWRKG